HANNEIGTMIDLPRVSALCEEHGALLHSDSVQTMGHFRIDVEEVKLAFLSCSAHKMHGPKGVGFIYINSENIIKPYLHGGAQERNMRAGTENIYGIVGLAKAFELAHEEMEARSQHIRSLRQYFKDQLEVHFEDIQYNGDEENEHLYTVLSVSFPPSSRSGLLLLSLDIAGISASGGSACSSGADAGSHVITALGGDPERTTIRFSFSHYNTQAEIDFVLEQMKSILPVRVAV
ncbi:MAG: aminotransferase class V-fold PLP-dependent enzyme, partial [Bacteroidota bacterium]